MKGLRKYLTPFAPDQSGAVSVLYSMGGILVIIDAGGCVGNICGFDEPRWQGHKSAVFSAGLRDMDAILGRDEMLVRKLTEASREIGAGFAALIGTPVPAVIGTDYYALGKMAERKTGLPVLTIDTNGMELYDKGASKAYLELVSRFAGQGKPGNYAAVLGCNPLDMGGHDAEKRIRAHYLQKGYDRCLIYGSEGTLSWIAEAGGVSVNIVVSPSGLAAARYLKRKFGTEYIVEDPIGTAFAEDCRQRITEAGICAEGKILIVDQQVTANSIRKALAQPEKQITAASWFLMDPELKEEQDVRLTEEDDFEELVMNGGFDVIIADPVLKRMVKDPHCLFIEKNQFPMSGKSMKYEGGSGIRMMNPADPGLENIW